MNKRIVKLKSNPFYTVSKSNYICPICSSYLYTAYTHMDMVMDGNSVYYCENNEEHIFWQNARESSNILHLYKNASETKFHSDKDFELILSRFLVK